MSSDPRPWAFAPPNYRPNVNPPRPPSSVRPVPAQTLNDNRPQVRKPATGANGKVVPVVYGNAQVDGMVFALDYSNDTWTVGYVICEGEIDGYDNILFNGETAAVGVSVTEYYGTQVQVKDPKLDAVITDYEDALLGVAYIVVEYAGDIYDSWPRVTATVRGKKVYNPSTTTTVYSQNPALHLADLLDTYLGMTVDWASVITAQDYCDDTTPGEVRRQSFAVLDSAQPVESWIEVLRAYASCFVIYDGDTVYLKPDKTEVTTDMTFIADDIVDGSISIIKADSGNLPTSIRIEYTDTSETVWRTRYSQPATKIGEPVRESRVSLTGITRHSQAYREAVERLNKLWLSDLTVAFQTYADALALQVGDIISVTHPYGLTAKLLRVAETPRETGPGLWSIVAAEYDSAAYSDTVAAEPTFTDGNLPSTVSPEAPTNFGYTERLRQNKNGEYVARAVITWSASPSLFVTGYNVRVVDNESNEVYNANTAGLSATTPPLKELINYTVTITPYTPLSTGTNSLIGLLNVQGKTAVPDPPTGLSGFEAGGQVRLNWNAPTGELNRDVKRYQIRYGDTTGSWETATVLNEVDSLRDVINDLPPSENATGGVWRFYVKSIDSVFQESATAATLDVVVTLDNDAFVADQVDPITEHSLATNMHVTVESRTGADEVAYTDSGETWGTLFGASAMSTFTNPLISYQTAPTVTWASALIDLLSDQSGTFLFEDPPYTLFNGTLLDKYGVKTDAAPTFTWGSQSSVKATARYSRLRLAGNVNIRVELPGGSLRANVVATEETGSDTSSAAGATTITLSKQYAAVRSLVITPKGNSTTARFGVYDNIQLDNGGVTTFDVYIFDTSNNKTATEFLWQWKGV